MQARISFQKYDNATALTVGLHGADRSSQTNETLATETRALKSSESAENSLSASAGAVTGPDKRGSESNLLAALAPIPL